MRRKTQAKLIRPYRRWFIGAPDEAVYASIAFSFQAAPHPEVLLPVSYSLFLLLSGRKCLESPTEASYLPLRGW
jgi:hypothetical protein